MTRKDILIAMKTLNEREFMKSFFSTLTLLLTFGLAHAAEGMFLPMKGKIPVQQMKDLGFEVSEDSIINMSKGGVLHYSNGCTATFQSPDGLFGTNHHCAQGYCVENLAVEQKKKFEQEGFVASTRDQEIKCSDDSVRILNNVKNVSAEFLNIENSGAAFDKKFETIETKMKKMVEQCENHQKTKYCKVAVMDNEKEPYYLYEFDVLDDIRLVWYPPDSLGAFGGETDNWEYPRYSIDFSFLRAYKDGKPYSSQNFVHTSTEGVKPGDPSFIVGFPGNTDRNITSVETKFIRDISIPWVNQTYTELAALLANNESYNQSYNYLLNYKKNTELKADLMDRYKVVEGKRDAETNMPDIKDTIEQATQIIEKKYAYTPTLFMLRLNNRMKMAKSLGIANEYIDAMKKNKEKGKLLSSEQKKEDLQKLKDKIKNIASQFDVEMDVKLLSFYFEKLDGLTVPIKAFTDLKTEAQTHIQNELKKNPASVRDIVLQKKTNIYRQMAQYVLSQSTLVKDAAFITHLGQFDKDRMVILSKALKETFTQLETEMNRLDNQLNWYNRKINIARAAPTPDANATMRFTLGTVQQKYIPLYKKGTFGYSTFLTGMKARNNWIKDKNHPDYPYFQMPAELLNTTRLAAAKSPFADSTTKDIPVNFISDNVITGGNSGSGVYNKKGELVGYAFDGTPESVLGDLSENPEARTILLDIRMVGFMGTEVYPQAKPILQELGMIK